MSEEEAPLRRPAPRLGHEILHDPGEGGREGPEELLLLWQRLATRWSRIPQPSSFLSLSFFHLSVSSCSRWRRCSTLWTRTC